MAREAFTTWSIRVIKPIHNSGDKLDFSNYGGKYPP